jgi:hypothetical protein
MWTRTARGLAESGIASIRFDYPEMGDSTGEARPSMEAPPVEEALAVAAVGMEVTGVTELAVVGNCLGARTAFAVAGRVTGCKAVACVLINRPEALVERPARRRAIGVRAKVAKRRGLEQLIRRIFRLMPRASLEFIAPVREVVSSVPCDFVLLGDSRAAHRLARAARKAAAGNGRVGDVEVHHIPSGPIPGFRIPLELQSTVIESLVGWLDRTLPQRPHVPSDFASMPATPVTHPAREEEHHA